MSEDMKWTRKPKVSHIGDGHIEIVTEPHTDLWQRTYYHFRNDSLLVLKGYGQLLQRVLLCNIDHCYDTLLRLLGEQGALRYVEPFESVSECEGLLLRS